jgi:tetratricopeptide (TPR) repeat protein
VLLREEGKFRQAIEQLEIIARNSTVNQDPAAAPFANLGDLYRREGFLAKAEELMTKAIDVGDVSAASATVLQRLARIDYDRGQYAKAQPEFERALALADKDGGPDLRPSLIEDLGNLRREIRQFAEASRLYTEALVLRERDAPDTPMHGQLLESMATLAMRQNRLAEAEPLLLRARRIYERTLPAENVYLALCLGRLATLYRDLKRTGDVEALFKRSIELQEKTMTPDAPVLATTLTNYAQFLREQNRASEASALEQRVRQLQAAGRS